MNLDLEIYLKQFCEGEGKVYFMPNPGNAGDALIALGAFHLFEKIGLHYEIITDLESVDLSNQVVFYSGGGNLVRYYTDCLDFFIKYSPRAKKMVLLPHTIEGNEGFLAKLGANVDLICRELKSYEHASSNVTSANVYLSHDTAFYIDTKKVLSFKTAFNFYFDLLKESVFKIKADKTSRHLPIWPLVLKQDVFILKTYTLKHATKLNAFRTDVEKTEIQIPSDNLDLSNYFGYDHLATHDKRLTLYTCYRFLSFLNKFDTISTNRLHVCIGSALIGKRVNFYSNSYHKCESIYLYSLKERFSNVKWLGSQSL